MSANFAEGTVFAGRYRVVRCVAAGGMGAVYEVVHLETDRRRALKVMHAHLFQSEEMRDRFKREARIAAQIDSEYIVDVSDAGVDDATRMPFMVMELLRGEELGVRLERLGRLPADEVVTYMQQAAWALDKTHAASIVHRDLKPENLFLTTRDDGTPRIKILDFGVAKLIAENATTAGATQSLGTPLYMAPEQFRTNAKLTPAADIHALTLMTYTLLVGEAYWTQEAEGAGDLIALALAMMHGPQESAVKRAARRGVTLPPGFDAWFAKGTAVNPTDRFPTATETVRALRAIGSPAGAGIAAVAATSSAGTSFTGARSALLDGASNSMGASAMPASPVERSRLPFVAIAAVLGLSMVGLGVWLTLRPAAPSPVGAADATAISALPMATSAAPAASSAVAIEVVPAEIPASAAPSASAPAAIALASKPVGPAPSARVPVAVKPPPVKKPPPSKTLLGRD